MTRAENAAQARRATRQAAVRALHTARARQESGPQALGSAATVAANLTAVHLADSKGDDLALIWAREAASVARDLWGSQLRALRRRSDAARAVL